MNKPIILCGLGRIGWSVLEYLQAANLPVVAIDNQCAPDEPRLNGARLVQGDCRRPEILEQAGLRHCGGVVIAISEDLVNVSTALVVRSIEPEVRVVLRVFNENLMGRLGKAIHNIVPLSSSALVAPLLAIKAITGQAVGTFRVEGAGADGQRLQVAELTVPGGSTLRGRTVKEIIDRYHVFILVHVPVNGIEHFLTEVDLSARLQVGDHLGVCGEPADVNALLTHGDNKAGDNLLWAGWLRRNGRTLWRTLREIDLSVKACTIALVVVIFASTLVFLGWRSKATVGDALYSTISVMATAADMRAAAETDHGREELKIFVSILRLIGAALIAAFTAIVTNYLLRASLGGALEVRRIPDGGHVIVSGLGRIGYRVVEELVKAGERVVVVEVKSDNRFVTTVRASGVPVIVGDASIPDVLRQAHGGSARAVVACTNDDMANLEVALSARELKAEQRVVLLLNDPQLAKLLRDAANVRLAVSVPALTAPAFVAGLFGDRVLSVFMLRDRLLAVIDLVIQAQDTHLIEQSGRTVAVDHHLLPVAVVKADGSPPPRDPFYASLGVGDRLVAVAGLSDLERLLRRQPAPAEWAVDVTGFELAAREWLMLFAQDSRKMAPEAVEDALERVPFCLDSGLTRGQAFDLLALLKREHVHAIMRRNTDGRI